MKKTIQTSILVISSKLEETVMNNLCQPGYRIVKALSGSEGLRKMFDEVFELIFVSYSQMKQDVICRIEQLAKICGTLVCALPI